MAHGAKASNEPGKRAGHPLPPLASAVWFLTDPERMSGELRGLGGLRCAEPFSLRELIPETKNWCNMVDFCSTAKVGSSSF